MEGHERPGVEGYGPVGAQGQFGGVPLFVDALVLAGVPYVQVGEEAVVVFVFVAEGGSAGLRRASRRRYRGGLRRLVPR